MGFDGLAVFRYPPVKLGADEGSFPMQVNLTPETQEILFQAMRHGSYASIDETVREGMRLIMQQSSPPQPIEELRKQIDPALRQVERGQTVELTDELVEAIKKEGRTRLSRTMPS